MDAVHTEKLLQPRASQTTKSETALDLFLVKNRPNDLIARQTEREQPPAVQTLLPTGVAAVGSQRLVL